MIIKRIQYLRKIQINIIRKIREYYFKKLMYLNTKLNCLKSERNRKWLSIIKNYYFWITEIERIKKFNNYCFIKGYL